MTSEDADSSNGDGDEEEEQSDLLAFLNKSGAVELMATITVEGVRYGDFAESFGVSHDTVSNHLRQAEELGLIEPESVRGEQGVTHKWVLTHLGARIHHQLLQMGAVNDYELLQLYRLRGYDHEEELREWVKEREEADDLHDKNLNYQSYARLKRPSRNPDDGE